MEDWIAVPFVGVVAIVLLWSIYSQLKPYWQEVRDRPIAVGLLFGGIGVALVGSVMSMTRWREEIWNAAQPRAFPFPSSSFPSSSGGHLQGMA